MVAIVIVKGSGKGNNRLVRDPASPHISPVNFTAINPDPVCQFQDCAVDTIAKQLHRPIDLLFKPCFIAKQACSYETIKLGAAVHGCGRWRAPNEARG